MDDKRRGAQTRGQYMKHFKSTPASHLIMRMPLFVRVHLYHNVYMYEQLEKGDCKSIKHIHTITTLSNQPTDRPNSSSGLSTVCAHVGFHANDEHRLYIINLSRLNTLSSCTKLCNSDPPHTRKHARTHTDRRASRFICPICRHPPPSPHSMPPNHAVRCTRERT